MSLVSFTPVTDGSTATAAGVNTPLSTIYNDYNGNITNANISASAAIAISKISTDALLPQLKNPYKFSVYRSAALSVTNTGKILFDTKLYDTGSNFDNVTNYRFTAPIAGFYEFSAVLTVAPAGSMIYACSLYKNGSELVRGNQLTTIASPAITQFAVKSPGSIQLSANDYIEVYLQTSYAGGAQTLTVGQAQTYFGGSLVSQT